MALKVSLEVCQITQPQHEAQSFTSTWKLRNEDKHQQRQKDK